MATGYTHANWRIETWNMIDGLNDQLGAALDHMHAGLLAVGAGQTQTAQSARWKTGNADLVTQGKQIIGDHDPRLTRVGAAQAAAGGVTEVAQVKRYNHV
jgi:hypothetical protein